mgnify:CR=1 FL=1
MPQDKDELLQVLITKYAQMYMKLAYAIGVPYDDCLLYTSDAADD